MFDDLNRLGFHSETSSFSDKKTKKNIIKNIIDSYLNSNIKYDFFIKTPLDKFQVSFTLTGFGPNIYIPNKKIMYDVVDRVFKQQQKIIDYDWINNRNEKYHDTQCDRKYSCVAFIPNFNNISNINFKKLSDFIFKYNGYIKLHPLTNYYTEEFLKKRFGEDNIINKEFSGISILKNADTVGLTSTTELTILAYFLNKKIYDLDNDNYYMNGSTGSLVQIYKVIKEQKNLEYFLNTLYGGILPWKYCTEDNIKSYIDFLKDFFNKYNYA